MTAEEGRLSTSIDTSSVCPVFEEKGECRAGYKCRFLGAHVNKSDAGSLDLVKDIEKVSRRKLETIEMNFLPPEAFKNLRTRKV